MQEQRELAANLSKGLINAGIAGIGSYVPEKVLTNAELEKMVDTTDEWIFTRSGIRERRIASPDQATSDLAVIAAKRAIADAGMTAQDLDLVIVATNTSDMLFPATACLVQDRIGAKNAGAFDLAAGCTGFVYGMAVGSQFIATGANKAVLVVGAETLSRITNWEERKTCILFGDGAGAAVLRPVTDGSGILSSKLWSDGSCGPLLMLPAGGSRRPATHETVDQKLHYIHMRGRDVFKFAVKVIEGAAVKALDAAGLTKTDIDFFILHQANVRIINAAAKRLGLPVDKAQVNVDRYGNTSTASIPLALGEAVRGGKIKKGDHVLIVGFGAGMTWGSMVVKW